MISLTNWLCNHIKHLYKRGIPLRLFQNYHSTMFYSTYMVQIQPKQVTASFFMLGFIIPQNYFKSMWFVFIVPTKQANLWQEIEYVIYRYKGKDIKDGKYVCLWWKSDQTSYVVEIGLPFLKSKDYVWHTPSMKEGVVPHPGIDVDARWGYRITKEWIIGYKLYLACNTDPSSIIVYLGVNVIQ